MNLKSKILALGALAFGLATPQTNYLTAHDSLKRIKYAPRALPKSRAGAKLRRKAREGKLGIAVLK